MNLCNCGCGKEVANKNNKFISGHNMRLLGLNNKGKILSTEQKLKISKINTGRLAWNKGIGFSESTKQKMSLSRKGKPSNFLGHHLSYESKQKIRERKIGIVQTVESKLKNSESHIGSKNYWYGKNHSPETKFKMSISAIEYINNHLRDEKKVTPRVGNNEIPIINQIENAIGIKGISNDYDLFLRCGKWPDRYYKEYNLCVDVLEDHHFKVIGELSDNDQSRQAIIAWKLGCMIYYINEQNFLNDQEKEIQRFKDFIEVIKE